jgi:hypothetical protein
MRWVGHVAEEHTKFWYEDLGIYGRIILKQILNKWHRREWTTEDKDLCWAP